MNQVLKYIDKNFFDERNGHRDLELEGDIEFFILDLAEYFKSNKLSYNEFQSFFEEYNTLVDYDKISVISLLMPIIMFADNNCYEYIFKYLENNNYQVLVDKNNVHRIIDLRIIGTGASAYIYEIDNNTVEKRLKPSIVENNEINLNLERVIFNNRKLNFQKKFNFKKGSIYGLVGENGVGKSTILKILNGYNIKYDGSVNYYEGFDWSNCMLLDSNDYRYDASVVRNLCFDSLFSTQLIDKYANKLNFNYEYSKYKNFRSLSSGEAQKIKIIRSLLLEKEVYLFDEIERGLDMKSIENLKEILYNLKKRQAIVIIVTHGRDLLDICDHIYEVESNDD